MYYAYGMYFGSGYVSRNFNYRYSGLSYRLALELAKDSAIPNRQYRYSLASR